MTKRPEHPLVVALVQAFAQRAGIAPDRLWAYLDRREPPPDAVRAALVEAFYPVVSPDDFLLPSVSNDDKLRHTMQPEMMRTVPGRPLESNHKFADWLRSQRLTIADWARNHVNPQSGQVYTRSRVKSWIAEGVAARPIPRSAADLIERESQGVVKATARTWPNGIRER